jgi:hypothetical protein
VTSDYDDAAAQIRKVAEDWAVLRLPRTAARPLRGPEVELLYREGAAWLAGSPNPGAPLGWPAEL